jgi:hypothetical protein
MSRLIPPPPLEPDVRALLDEERSAPDPSGQARDRVRARVLVSVGLAAPVIAAAGASSAAASAAAVTASPGGTTALSSTPSLLGGVLTGKGIVLVVAIGGAVGGASYLAHRHFARTAPVVAPTSAAIPPSRPAMPSVPLPPPAVPPMAAGSQTLAGSPPPLGAPAATRRSPARPHMLTAAAASARASRPRGDVPGADETLAAERALLEQARAALADGDPRAALEAIDHHERSFSDATLAEERDSLRVKALAAAGHHDEARARTAAFRRRFPSSIFLPAVESALRALP